MISKKRAQITLYLTLGTVMLLSIGLLFYIGSSKGKNIEPVSREQVSLQQDAVSVKAFVNNCIELSFFETKKNRGLKEEYESLIERDIEYLTGLCTNGFEVYKTQELQIEADSPKADVAISDKALTVNLKYPITIKRGASELGFSDFSYTWLPESAISVTAEGATHVSTDKMVEVKIPAGTTDADGNPITAFSSKVLDKNYNGMSNDIVIGNLIYDLRAYVDKSYGLASIPAGNAAMPEIKDVTGLAAAVDDFCLDKDIDGDYCLDMDKSPAVIKCENKKPISNWECLENNVCGIGNMGMPGLVHCDASELFCLGKTDRDYCVNPGTTSNFVSCENGKIKTIGACSSLCDETCLESFNNPLKTANKPNLGEKTRVVKISSNGVKVTITVRKKDIPPGMGSDGLSIARFDEDNGLWLSVETTVVNENGEEVSLSAEIDHFSLYAIVADCNLNENEKTIKFTFGRQTGCAPNFDFTMRLKGKGGACFNSDAKMILDAECDSGCSEKVINNNPIVSEKTGIDVLKLLYGEEQVDKEKTNRITIQTKEDPPTDPATGQKEPCKGGATATLSITGFKGALANKCIPASETKLKAENCVCGAKDVFSVLENEKRYCCPDGSVVDDANKCPPQKECLSAERLKPLGEIDTGCACGDATYDPEVHKEAAYCCDRILCEAAGGSCVSETAASTVSSSVAIARKDFLCTKPDTVCSIEESKAKEAILTQNQNIKKKVISATPCIEKDKIRGCTIQDRINWLCKFGGDKENPDYNPKYPDCTKAFSDNAVNKELNCLVNIRDDKRNNPQGMGLLLEAIKNNKCGDYFKPCMRGSSLTSESGKFCSDIGTCVTGEAQCPSEQIREGYTCESDAPVCCVQKDIVEEDTFCSKKDWDGEYCINPGKSPQRVKCKTYSGQGKKSVADFKDCGKDEVCGEGIEGTGTTQCIYSPEVSASERCKKIKDPVKCIQTKDTFCMCNWDGSKCIRDWSTEGTDCSAYGGKGAMCDGKGNCLAADEAKKLIKIP